VIEPLAISPKVLDLLKYGTPFRFCCSYQASYELPAVPYFLFDPKKHFIDLEDAAQTRRVVTLLSLLDDFDARSIVYDSEGSVWSFLYDRSKSSMGFVGRVLANTVYNPKREVVVSWSRVRQYGFQELREAYLDAVEADDDILTQHVEQEELQERVRRCIDFNDFVETWQWMNTDHDE